MKRSLVLVLFGVIFLSGAVSVSAVVENQDGPTVVDKAQLIIQHKEELRAQYKANLQQIKDEQKLQLTERIRSRMCVINQNRTQTMLDNLERMAQILTKAEEKTALVKGMGKDVAAVETEIGTAREKIAAAKMAVGDQAGTGCSLEISGSEYTLRNEVRKGITTLEDELVDLNTQIRATRRAVSNVIVALAHSMGNPIPTKAVVN